MQTPSIPSSLPPFMTATSAAKALGYANGSYLSVLCTAGKIPGAYKEGRIWFVPREWVIAKKKEDEAAGIQRGKKSGRPVTTGAGVNRNRPVYVSNGKPRGRPRKQVTDN